MTNIYRGYNIDTAVRLLGPADYTAPNVSQSFSQALTNAIVLIWKSIARIYNLIFGDRLWYDNGVACRLFISASLQNDATPANWVALDRLREQLQSRAQEPTFYTSGPCSLAQFVEEEIHNEIFNLTASQARLSPPPKRNILAEKIVRFNKKQEKAEWSQIAQDNPALAKDIRRQRVALSPSEIQLAAQQIALNLADQTLFAIDLLPTDEIDLSQMNHKQCNALLISTVCRRRDPQ
jgi:hypothetical protein